MKIEIENTPLKINEEDIFIFQLTHANGSGAKITNYGAIVMAFTIINNENKEQDIVLGFDSVVAYLQKEYRAAYPYFGAIIGRTANRIKNGKFTLNNREFQLEKNLGADNLHGGPEGLDSKVWEVVEYGDIPNPFVKLQYTSKDMEGNYPGNLTITVLYTLLENELQYEITAVTDQPTLFNPTQHTYFNLNEDWGPVDSHKLRLHAKHYLEQDESLCVTGKLIPVENTIYDFTEYKHMNRNWDEENGYDQSFVIDEIEGNKYNAMQLAAECWPMLRQFKLEVYTTAPIVHVYTGRWIPQVTGKYDIPYTAFSGICFETQLHPNGINIPGFPSGILNPGEQFYQKNSYKIVTINTPVG